MADYGDLEAITRIYCQKRGIDPDAQALIPCPDGKPGCLVAHYGPQWKRYEPVVRDGIALIEAITQGFGQTVKYDGVEYEAEVCRRVADHG